MLRLPYLLAGALVLTLISTAWAQSPAYPAPKTIGDPARLGTGIQRTMTLLATSTPEKRNTVRVLFYGQSITEQDWWKIVASDLKKRFPNANLIIENRALGGYASQMLVKAAETDLYACYPDLMIFHVYGSHLEYENIIQRTRQRTTAEVLIQTDHCTRESDFTEETDPARLYPNGKIWNSFMNYKFLPETAKKHGCAMVDQRNLWKQYLQENNLKPQQLLRDGVHLNDHGCYLMGEFVKACLVKREDTTIDPMNCAAVRTLVVGKDVQWQGERLVVEFEGNRVDLIAKDGTATPAKILIDGRKPSEIPELYGFTRALAKPGGKWPVVMNLKSKTLLQREDWTMQVKKDPANEKLLTFSLTGSKSGPDGEGRSDQKFVSRSARIVIEPDDWHVPYALGLAGVKPVPDSFTVKWQTIPHFVDEFISPGIKDKTVETTVTIAQGLKNGKHILEITGGAETLGAVRVYCPK